MKTVGHVFTKRNRWKKQLNRRNVGIWGSENPHTYVEHQETLLKSVCSILEYSIDVCRVTRGAHIENF
jgi:hypothetical protein